MELNKSIGFCLGYFTCTKCEKIIYFNACNEHHGLTDVCDKCKGSD